ncbi:hypothetical protein BAU01nite_22190 [Brevibacterium aurantiacum]|nr:hypothetical protein BAU01nite_22190 [Brevibacterium aurantiacum]
MDGCSHRGHPHKAAILEMAAHCFGMHAVNTSEESRVPRPWILCLKPYEMLGQFDGRERRRGKKMLSMHCQIGKLPRAEGLDSLGLTLSHVS